MKFGRQDLNHSALSLAIFFVTIILVLWQPGRLNIGISAVIGAIAGIATGVNPISDVYDVWKIVWDPTLTFVGLILISLSLEKIGFFEWMALRMIALSEGDGKRLFFNMIILGAGVSAIFANDGGVLILTPIILAQMIRLGMPRQSLVAFVMGGGFVADITSLPLPISNLVNILSADYFHLSFWAYSIRMIPVDIAAFLVSSVVLFLYYKTDIPESFTTSEIDAESVIRDPFLFRFAWGLLPAMAVMDFVLPFWGIPISAITLGTALILLGIGMKGAFLNPVTLIGQAPWRIVFFSMGMYVVVFGMGRTGLLSVLTELVRSADRHGLVFGIFGVGFMTAGLSAVMNNLPAVMMGAIAIHTAALSASSERALALANVIGCDLGPKMTTIGSLATLLWLHVLEGKGLRIGSGYYMKVGLILTIPVLGVTLGALWFVEKIYG